MTKRIASFGLTLLLLCAMGGAIVLQSPSFQPTVFKYRHLYYKIFYGNNNVNEFLRRAYQTFDVPKHGIIHIGARYAEELVYYKHHKIQDVLWIEADPEAEVKLRQAVAKHTGSKVAMFAVTDTNGFIDLHKTANDGHSSSILKLKNHLVYYPTIIETKTLHVPQMRLDDYFADKEQEQAKYNVVVMDIQGAELIALKGAPKTLENIDAIIAETNYNELYEGAAFIKDLDDYLVQHHFVRVDTASGTHYTGDALFVKDTFFKLRS